MSYLRRRPRCECRALFLRVIAPRGGWIEARSRWIVREACDRAGLPRVGCAQAAAHRGDRDAQTRRARCRRSAQVLRHRELKTTAQYAKVDRNAAAGAGAAVAVAGRCGMTPLREALGDYLRIRRQLGFELREEGRLLDGLRRVPGAGRRRADHHRACADVGDIDVARTRTGAVGASDGARLRPLPGHARPCTARFPPRTCCPPTARGSRHTSTPTAEITALIAAAGRLTPAAARGASPDADRAVGGHRPAARGGARARPPGRRPAARRAARPRRQAQQAARGARCTRARPPPRFASTPGRAMPASLSPRRRRSSSPRAEDGSAAKSSTRPSPS